ncbi:UNVERIFIED_CONTAM: hypothetical protein GTU68_044970 [Idotea baltica]|nr:hypothetical protein [Idotea baltica]
MDSDGWLPIDELIQNANNGGKKLTHELILEVVRSNDKRRFKISDDGTKIRASQGHSVRSVDLELPAVKPPDQLYHGTVEKFLHAIQTEGLQKRARNHVHLTAQRATAETVGGRRGTPVILVVESGRMHSDGLSFYCSDNGVWLIDSVPTKYLTFPSEQ